MKTNAVSLSIITLFTCMVAFGTEPINTPDTRFNGKWQLSEAADVKATDGMTVRSSPNCILTITVKGTSATLDYSPGTPDTGTIRGSTLSCNSEGPFDYEVEQGKFIKTIYKATVTITISDDGNTLTKTKIAILPAVKGKPRYSKIEIYKRIR